MKIPALKTERRRATNSRGTRPGRSQRAFSLIECMVYGVVLLVIMGMALACYYRAEGYSRQLKRNADSIVQALQAGERWREDLRTARAAPRWAETGSNAVLEISVARGPIRYSFRAGTVYRQAPGERSFPLLTGVRESRMEVDPRRWVRAWRWELELASQLKAARVRPLFTFEAALPKGGQS